jgi:hypothetical protein
VGVGSQIHDTAFFIKAPANIISILIHCLSGFSLAKDSFSPSHSYCGTLLISAVEERVDEERVRITEGEIGHRHELSPSEWFVHRSARRCLWRL